MPRVQRKPDGTFVYQFRGPDGKRKTKRFYRTTENDAQTYACQIEELLHAKRYAASLKPITSAWLSSLGREELSWLRKSGLIDDTCGATLGELIEDFRESLAVKPNTMKEASSTFKNLLAFFNANTRVDSIRPSDAVQFRSWMLRSANNGVAYSVATVSHRCHRARQLFQHAVRSGRIESNPFGVIKRGKESNIARDFYVTREAISAVLRVVPDPEFRAVIVLARYAALRCPSEIISLRRDDVDWKGKLLQIRQSKTGHRVVPLFLEVQPALEACKKNDPLFPTLQKATSSNLTKRFQNACRLAGVEPWPKTFQNMRATRESELIGEYPIDAVAEWLGHSPSIALLHYRRVSANHFLKAVGGVQAPELTDADSDANRARLGLSHDAPGHTKRQKNPETPRHDITP